MLIHSRLTDKDDRKRRPRTPQQAAEKRQQPDAPSRAVLAALAFVLLITGSLAAQTNPRAPEPSQPASAGQASPATVSDAGTDLFLRANQRPSSTVAAESEQEARRSVWAAAPFAEGNRYWSLRFAGSVDPSLGEIYHARVAAGKYVDDAVALYLGVSAGYADARTHRSGFLGGPEVGIRWHFLHRDNWSLFLDASSGVVLHEHPVTEDSLRFNFNLQAGIGATCQLSDTMLLQGGIAWQHLSNARVRGKEHNLGYDGPMGYVGVVMPF